MGKLQLEISRPFRLGGFATGDYMCKCMTCGGEFTGDKRAMTCLPCVVDRINAARSEAQPSDGGKSLGERLFDALNAVEEFSSTQGWADVEPDVQGKLDRAAVTFTASLSGGEGEGEARPEPARERRGDPCPAQPANTDDTGKEG